MIHSAAIPEPTRNPPHQVFRNNLMATFNVIEAAVRFGVPRVVNVSSETVPGFFFPEREFLPDYAPVDEEHPIRPQDPYALAKHFGEQLMDAAVRRSDLTGVSIRPVLGAVGGQLRRATSPPRCATPRARRARACGPTSTSTTSPTRCGSPPRRDTPGHEVVYIASPDNHANRPLAELVRHHHGDAIELRELDREDASGISIAQGARAARLRPEPLLARLPDRRRRAAARGGRAVGARGDCRPARPGAHRLMPRFLTIAAVAASFALAAAPPPAAQAAGAAATTRGATPR